MPPQLQEATTYTPSSIMEEETLAIPTLDKDDDQLNRRPDTEEEDEDEDERLAAEPPGPPQRQTSVAQAAVEELEYIDANSKLERVNNMNEITASSIHVDSKLGEGSFAMALKVQVKAKGFDDKQHFALKCLAPDTKSADEHEVEKALEDLAVEGTLWSCCFRTYFRHPYLSFENTLM